MFDFGKNWKRFSQHALDEEKIEHARQSLVELLGTESLENRSFLDIGCGTGIFSIAARQLGAGDVVGVDINPTCVDTSIDNAQRFLGSSNAPRFEVVSVLDRESVRRLGTFDIVYAWGSLHHTGDMETAIRHAAGAVRAGGTFVLAIYNRHFTSPAWKAIKWSYNKMPVPLRGATVLLFTPVIATAKFAVTRRNVFTKQRGMNFFFDIIDWLGGFPYEYASKDDIERGVCGKGFELAKYIPATVPTGCNQFVFRVVQ